MHYHPEYKSMVALICSMLAYLGVLDTLLQLLFFSKQAVGFMC